MKCAMQDLYNDRFYNALAILSLCFLSRSFRMGAITASDRDKSRSMHLPLPDPIVR